MQLGSYIDDNKEGAAKPPTIVKTTAMVQGKAKFDLNVKEYDAFLPYKNSASYAPITVTVEEEFTGVKINGTTSTHIYPYRYAMHCHECYSFEADKEMNVSIQLTYVDGSHLKDTKNPVEISYTEVLSKNQWYRRMYAEGDETTEATTTTVAPPVSENRTVTFKGYMNETGFVTFPVSLADLQEYEGYSHYYSMECAYLDEKRELSTTYQHREPKHVDQPMPEEPKDYFRILEKWGDSNA